jgi:hypothetical protein
MLQIFQYRGSATTFALGAAVCLVLSLMLASPAGAQGGRTTCEPGKYPDDGNFEAVEVTENTPAIVDIQNGQKSRRQPYAEAGTIVIVWSRSGQYFCVESPTGIPDIYFWVDRRSLKSIPVAANSEDPWIGTYGQPSTVEIKSTNAGTYEVHGEYEHTIQDGPGWSASTRNEIFAHDAKPQGNAIHVSLRRNIVVAGAKAPKDLTSPGLIDDHCTPVLFVKGPVLLIKDIGDCGDGSVFQGYYLRDL